MRGSFTLLRPSVDRISYRRGGLQVLRSSNLLPLLSLHTVSSGQPTRTNNYTAGSVATPPNSQWPTAKTFLGRPATLCQRCPDLCPARTKNWRFFRSSPPPLRSQLGFLALATGITLLYLTFCLPPLLPGDLLRESRTARAPILNMAQQASPGRPGNLTPEQDEKLRQLWAHVLKLCGKSFGEEGAAAEPDAKANGIPGVATTGLDSEASSPGKQPDKSKKKRIGLFGKRSKEKAGDDDSVTSQASSQISTHIKEGDASEDKYGQTQQFLDAIASQTPEALRATIWSMVKHDHPDALLLRFLRARKWDVDKALVMMISTMNWRLTEMHVDDDIMKNGEAGAVVVAKGNSENNEAKIGADFMAQIRMGKSFLHGMDKSGRPICVVRVRLHKQGEQCEESLERYTVYIIETARMVLSPPVDTAVCLSSRWTWQRHGLTCYRRLSLI